MTAHTDQHGHDKRVTGRQRLLFALVFSITYVVTWSLMAHYYGGPLNALWLLAFGASGLIGSLAAP